MDMLPYRFECNVGDLVGHGAFANADSHIWFAFQDDGLVSVVVWRKEASDYAEILGSLKEKYGAPISNNDLDYQDLPSLGYTALDLFSDEEFQAAFNRSNKMMTEVYHDLEYNDINQFIVPIENGYVNIICMSFEYQITPGMFSKSKKTEEVEGILLSYSFLKQEDYDDYNEQIMQNNQNRNNDL